jgi:hypothetical protein
MLTPFEVTLRDALALAQANRRAVGLKSGEYEPRKMRDGTRAVGPTNYKVTLHLTPWHYADAIHALRKYEAKHGKKISLHRLIENLIEDGVEHVSARPPKPPAKKKGATITPIRKYAPAAVHVTRKAATG